MEFLSNFSPIVLCSNLLSKLFEIGKKLLKNPFSILQFSKKAKKAIFWSKIQFFVNVARFARKKYPKLARTPCNTIRRRERKDLWRLSMHSSHCFSSNRRVVYLWHDHLLSPIGLSRQKTVMYSIKKFLFFKPPFSDFYERFSSYRVFQQDLDKKTNLIKVSKRRYGFLQIYILNH